MLESIDDGSLFFDAGHSAQLLEDTSLHALHGTPDPPHCSWLDHLRNWTGCEGFTNEIVAEAQRFHVDNLTTQLETCSRWHRRASEAMRPRMVGD